MTSTHTPGPWEVCGNFVRNPMPEGIIIAEATLIPEYQANARLIAAAPELLEALQFIEKTFGKSRDEYIFSKRAAIDKARAAIAKTTA